MKKIILLAMLLASFASVQSFAGNYESGWHKGFYLFGMGGMTQAGHDKNVDTNKKFGGTFIPAFGLTVGYDIVDWIGVMMQMQYGTATGGVGDGTVNHPFEHAREHAITMRLMGRYSLTQLANWVNFPENFAVVPYAKLGGGAHGLYVNASSSGNKIGAWGGGLSLGAGVEAIAWKKLTFGVDLTEDFMFLQSYYKTLSGVRTKIVDGGLEPMFTLMGTVGVHF